MTEILCRWLNEEIKVEPQLSGSSFAEQFSNGFLFGEVLQRHGLQNDFAHFSKGRSSEAKLNNFMRLEPTFKLLEVPFNINIARDIMTEKPGVATRIMYQLFVALNRKKQLQLTGQSIECMRPSGRVKLEKIETEIFQERLKHQTPRQVDLNFQTLIQKFQEKQRQHEELVASERQQQEERLQSERKEACHRALENSRQVREKQLQMYAKLKPLPTGKQKTPPQVATRTQLLAQERAVARHQAIAKETRDNIATFEASMRRGALPATGDQDQPSRPFSTGSIPDQKTSKTTPRHAMTSGPSADYISQIKKRVEDNATARKEREKRRRKVLVQQMNALQEQEEEKREKMLVERLMRQCQQERRIATQLMHIRYEKDTIRNNRILRQKQHEEQRTKEFQDALNREAELVRQEESERKVRLQHHLELHRRHLASRAERNYKKHYQLCRDILLQMVDLTTKMAHYRELTQGLIPAKLVRDWKTLFIAGRPQYEGEEGGGGEGSSSSSSFQQQDSEQLLDDNDFQEYLNVLCEWVPPESLMDQLPRPPDPILSHVVYRLLDQVDPPQPPPTPPSFPKFMLRGCFLGKPFSGKSTTLRRLADSMGVHVLSMEQLLPKAVETYLSEKASLTRGDTNELLSHPQTPSITVEPSSSVQMLSTSVTPQQQELQEGVSSRQEGASSQQEVDSTEQLSQLSVLAALGYKAHSAMVTGEAVDDATIVDIITEELRSLPDGTAWVLDNFPTTVEQAKFLATALTGQSKPHPHFCRNFVLLAEHETHTEELHANSGLDLVLHFTATTKVVLQRASQQDVDGAQAKSKLEQVQHQLLSFDENWSGLRQWFLQFRVLSTVNANRELESVYDSVQEKILEVVNKAKQADAMKKLGIHVPDYMLAPESSDLSSMSLTRIDIPTTETKVKSSRSYPHQHRPSSATSPSHKLHSPRKKAAPTKTSPRRKKKLEPRDSEDFIPVNPNAEPGSAEWQYCSMPLDMELARGLAGKWPGIEETYIKTMKGVFQLLRAEREDVCQYFYFRRNEFAGYLRRPSHKQEFVSQWQQNYNSLPDHLRCEDVMKAELHQRVDDLCDKLWDISDHRREEAEQERKRIAEDNWLNDHIGILTNHYITLMQVELDKFQDTVLFLKDYYTGMEGHVPSPLPHMGRIPLIELGVTAHQDPPASATSSMQSISQAEEGGKETAHERKVPLLPRQPPTDPVEDKGAKKKGGGAPTSPPPPTEDISNMELDQQLVVHSYNTAIAAVVNLMNSEVKVLEASIKAASQPLVTPTHHDKPPEAKEEKGAKGKGKAKSPGGKKGKTSPVKGGKGAPPPEPTVPEVPKTPTPSPKEVAKQQRLLHMNKEHRAAIQHEECTVKLRLELIKDKALDLIDNLKAKGSTMQEEMEQLLGQCYKQEVDSVSNLAEVMRQAIENETTLLHELHLPGPVFQIHESTMTFLPSPPPTPPSPLEASSPNHFTVQQVLALYEQFKDVSPSGFMLSKVFVDTIVPFADKAIGDDLLPDSWRTVTKEQIGQMCELLFGRESDYVDWRHFLVCVAQPWRLPTSNQLVEALERFTSVSAEGTVSEEQYLAVDTWLTAEQQPSSGRFNRAEKLKEAFFKIFADPKTQQLDYKNMLLSLCADPDPKEGVFKALSIAVGAPLSSVQEIPHDQTILLQEFYQILIHGQCMDQGSPQITTDSATPFVTMELLLDNFVKLNGGNPNEISLSLLLSDAVALQYLDCCHTFSLPDLSHVIRAQTPPEQEAD